MKIIAISLLLITLLLSCKEEEVKLTLEREKLVAVVADLHVAEEMLAKFRKEDKDSVKNIYINDIVAIHKIDTAALFMDIELMQKNPALGLEIYGEAYELLEEQSRAFSPEKDK